jgi:energy-coupling factor transporter ATP-binding protein EcfA2
MALNELPEVERFDRMEFIEERFHYSKGEHVSFLGPTGSGKTTLALQLMKKATSDKLPGIILVMKPRDDTATKFTKELGYRRVRTWPPPVSIYQPRKPPGWTLWPKFTFDPDTDDENMYVQFRSCILDSYKKGNRVLFGDEAYSLAKELGLEKEMITLWTKGRSMGCGLWAATQKPSHVPLWMYSQAQHLFLHNDPDERARKRYDEIGGVDPKLVISVVSKLKKHEWLYICRDGPVMAIVSK